MNEQELRDAMRQWGKSLFERGYTAGSSGNISVKTEDGYLMTPTNSCLGFLDPETISKLDQDGTHISGDKPSKEFSLHMAFYETRKEAGAVVHLHSTYATALSCLPHSSDEVNLPPYTPYFIMRIGRLGFVPYFPPGDKALADAVREQAPNHRAVLMANHGPAVSAECLEQAVFAMEELEETAKLHFILRGQSAKTLQESDIKELKKRFK